MSKVMYEAIYQMDDNGSWFVRVPEVKGAHSHGRSLAAARKNIRQALALVLDTDERDLLITDKVELPADLKTLADAARELRGEAAELQEFATLATVDAIKALSFGRLPLSLRDVSELLGISFQRVQQVRARALDEAQTAPSDFAVALERPELLDLMEALKASVERTRRLNSPAREEQASA
ncbi:MAG TPA: type II toxin-antitoxin system HicB family antitoxin [Actinomycetota bacterium]|nr:type II toxin-antitoxin system HicB family antitoxin [Actinomycetota bacterium]